MGLKKRAKANLFNRLRKQQSGLCFYCRCPVSFDPVDRLAPHYRSLDHIIPRSEGGRWNQDNFVMACRDCNLRRQTTPVEQFLMRGGAR